MERIGAAARGAATGTTPPVLGLRAPAATVCLLHQQAQAHRARPLRRPWRLQRGRGARAETETTTAAAEAAALLDTATTTAFASVPAAAAEGSTEVAFLAWRRFPIYANRQQAQGDLLTTRHLQPAAATDQAAELLAPLQCRRRPSLRRRRSACRRASTPCRLPELLHRRRGAQPPLQPLTPRQEHQDPRCRSSSKSLQVPALLL